MVEKGLLKRSEAVIRVQELPELIEGILDIFIPEPETIEYALGSGYIGVFDGLLKIKNPKNTDNQEPRKTARARETVEKNRSKTGVFYYYTLTEGIAATRKKYMVSLQEITFKKRCFEVIAKHLSLPIIDTTSLTPHQSALDILRFLLHDTDVNYSQ